MVLVESGLLLVEEGEEGVSVGREETRKARDYGGEQGRGTLGLWQEKLELVDIMQRKEVDILCIMMRLEMQAGGREEDRRRDLWMQRGPI